MSIHGQSFKGYRDRWMILLSVPVINLLNYYLSYSKIEWGSFLVITYLIDTLQGYCAWYAARWIIVKFDHVLPWRNNFPKRILIQLPLVVIAALLVIISLTELVNFIATDKQVPISFYTKDIFIFFIWAISINFLYMALYFLLNHQQEIPKTDRKQEASTLVIKTGHTLKRIPLKAFSYFFVSNELVYGITPDGKTPLPGYTLDRLEKLIAPTDFFRVNRQTIVTRPTISHVKKEENGKLALFVLADVETSMIMISRLRASAFKKWMAS